jgi:Flp pilus assembly protein TadB
MFERYDEQARDRTLSLVGAFLLLAFGVGCCFYQAWVAASIFVFLTLMFGVPPLFFGKERYEKYLRLLNRLPDLGGM